MDENVRQDIKSLISIASIDTTINDFDEKVDKGIIDIETIVNDVIVNNNWVPSIEFVCNYIQDLDYRFIMEELEYDKADIDIIKYALM